MPSGGARDGAGRKAKGENRPPPAVRRFAPPPPRRPRPERIRRRDGKLDPLDVMQENMEFYHEQAGKILAVIMTMPAGENADRLEALTKFADAARMRASSQACANDLAKYVHHSLAARPYAPEAAAPADPGTGRVIEHNPQLAETIRVFSGARAPAPTMNGHANGHSNGSSNGHG